MNPLKEKLQSLLDKEKDTPTLPEIGIQAMQIALDDSLAQKKLVRLITRYPDIASRVIHLANSPLFGLSGRIASIERAVNLLGIAPIRSLVLSLSVLIAMNRQKKQMMTPIFRQLQDNSFACGIGASLIAESSRYPRPDEAFLTGLLCHIGYFFILTQLDEESHFNLIEQHLKNPFDPNLESREKESFGFSHAEFGSLITARWYLPSHIVDSLRFHHEDFLRSSLEPNTRKLIHIIQGSIRLNHIFDGVEENEESKEFLTFVDERLSISPHECDRILLEFDQHLSEESSLFKLPVKPRKSYLNILRESNEKLYEISLDYLQTLEENKKLIEENERITKILEILFNNSPDAIVAIDGRGRPLMINKSIEKLVGISADDFLSGDENILDYYPPGLARKIMRILKSHQYGPPGIIMDYEACVHDRDGNEIPVSFSGALVEEDGKVKMTIGFLRDIRKRKAIQKELINARRYFDLIFNTIPDGIRVVGHDLTVTFENKKLKEMLGEGLGKKCYETHFHANKPRSRVCEDCWLPMGKTGQPQTKEYTSNDGKTYLISSSILEMEGQPPASVQVINDITMFKEQKRIETEQQKLKAVMELAGATAHELNQPLTAITMGLELVSRQHRKHRSVPDEVIKNILENVEKMSKIINRLSKITRYETRSYISAMKILDIDGSSENS